MTLVVLEGLSGTGKLKRTPRTVAALIGAAYEPSIPESMHRARREVDAQDDVNLRHLFYATAIAVQSVKLSEAPGTSEARSG